MPLLEANDLTIRFGGLIAVSNFRISIDKNQLVGLIGPNGAGKTTVFNMLTGVYLPTSGDIKFEDKSLVGLKPYQITEKKIARTFQNIRLFKELSVIDNIKISYNYQTKYNLVDAVIRTQRFYSEENDFISRAKEILKVFKLENKQNEAAKNLPYGEQRRLEIARALAVSPKLLLLDEPAAGMNPNETRELMDLIRFIRDRFDMTILLIEHDMQLIMGLCEKIVVLDYGKVIAEGNPQQIRNNTRVIEAYLGKEGGESYADAEKS